MSREKPKEKRPRESSSTDAEQDANILDALRKIQSRIESGFANMESDLEVVKQELREDARAMKQNIDVEISTENVQSKWNEWKEKISKHRLIA